MRRSDRLFEVIQILRRARVSMPAHAIAKILEVNKRTIYRDIAALQAMRVPIEGEAGIGYIMRPGFDLPPLMFTADEIEAIVVGLALLGRTGDAGLTVAASRVTRKLTDVLPRKQADIDGLSLHVSRWTAVPSTDVDPRIIRESIREERKLHVIYRDAKERETARTIWPVALMYYVDSIVLAGWCELRRDYRHFRIDRMAACAKTDALFTGEGRRVWSEWSSQQAARASTVVERT